MAKIRVYELARDLNMTNKVLLGKLQDLDFPVKSHMSSLDEETVTTIKERLLDLKPEGVEVTRVKPGIIQRRKKVVKKQDVKIALVSEPVTPSDEATFAEKSAKKAPEEKEVLLKPPAEKETKEEPANKIVAEIVPQEESSPPKTKAPLKSESVEKPLKIVTEKDEPKDELVEKETDPAKAVKPPAEKKLKPTKKIKKETPAKIIKLAVKPPKMITEETETPLKKTTLFSARH